MVCFNGQETVNKTLHMYNWISANVLSKAQGIVHNIQIAGRHAVTWADNVTIT